MLICWSEARRLVEQSLIILDGGNQCVPYSSFAGVLPCKTSKDRTSTSLDGWKLILCRWEFGIQLPGIFLCLCIAYISIPNDLGLTTGTKRKTLWEAMKVFDFKGSILLTTTITSLILGLVEPLTPSIYLTTG